MAEPVDVVVIGLGVGGEDVAGSLAQAGLHVVGVEEELVGGECPYWGCIPSKMIIRAANLLQEARRIPGTAGEATVTPDWAPVAARIREQATADWDDTIAVERLEGHGGVFVRGRAHIEGPGRVSVGDTEYEVGRGIVIAAGTSPAIPPIPGIDEVDYWTNRDAIRTRELPGSLTVLGGGAIGLELGQAFSRFGVDVTIVEALDRLAPLEEPEVGAVLADAFTAEGIEVHAGIVCEKVIADGPDTIVELSDGSNVRSERLLVATGRVTDLSGLGVANVGIDEGARFVTVDERMRAVENVWAIGDITGQGLFTHLALHQSKIAVADILGERLAGADHPPIPRVTFTDPEVGSVGVTEEAARAAGLVVATSVAEVPSTARGWMHGPGNEGVIKLVADVERDVLVGATSAGPHGGEVLSMLALAVHAEVPIGRLRTMIYAYPTFHRGVEDALRELETG